MRLIDADELLNQRVYSVRSGKEFPYEKAYKNMLHDIENAPTVEAEPITHGHWVKTIYGDFVCSCCHIPNCAEGNFCSWCGAKMVIVESHKDCCDYLDENCNCRLEDGQCNYQPLCNAGDCSMCVE